MPLEELINTYLPQFSGILDKYWGRNGIHLHSEYVGAAVIVLATAAFGGWSGARKRLLLFWTGVGVITLLWALGGSTPFFQIVYAIVPGTKFFRAPSTIMFVTTFATAVLAALGTERLVADDVTSRFAVGWLIGGAVVSLFAIAGGFGVLAQNVAVVAGARRSDRRKRGRRASRRHPVVHLPRPDLRRDLGGRPQSGSPHNWQGGQSSASLPRTSGPSSGCTGDSRSPRRNSTRATPRSTTSSRNRSPFA